MFSNILKSFPAIIFICLCLSCNRAENKSLAIEFSRDSSSILISNIEEAAVLQLKNNIKIDTMYQKLVSVLETPADNNSTGMEREWPGKLSMEENNIVFIPDSPFLKGKTYLVGTSLNMSFGDIERVIKGKMGTTMNFQQQLLKR